MQQYQRLVAELEHVLPVRGGGNGRGAADPLQALPAALHNLHEFFTHVAARLERLHEAVTAAKDANLATRRRVRPPPPPCTWAVGACVAHAAVLATWTPVQ